MEEERERLRKNISQLETNLRDLDDEKREINYKLKELEQTVRKHEEFSGKLENKLFHSNSRIRQLEEVFLGFFLAFTQIIAINKDTNNE